METPERSLHSDRVYRDHLVLLAWVRVSAHLHQGRHLGSFKERGAYWETVHCKHVQWNPRLLYHFFNRISKAGLRNHIDWALTLGQSPCPSNHTTPDSFLYEAAMIEAVLWLRLDEETEVQRFYPKSLSWQESEQAAWPQGFLVNHSLPLFLLMNSHLSKPATPKCRPGMVPVHPHHHMPTTWAHTNAGARLRLWEMCFSWERVASPDTEVSLLEPPASHLHFDQKAHLCLRNQSKTFKSQWQVCKLPSVLLLSISTKANLQLQSWAWAHYWYKV